MSKKSSYRQSLLESLADPIEAKHYLNGVLEDYPEGFLKALRNVAQAKQISKVAESAGVKRETLYRSLSDQGNPTLDTLTGVLGALGLKLSIDDVQGEPAISRPAPELRHQEAPKFVVIYQPQGTRPRYEEQEAPSLNLIMENVTAGVQTTWSKGEFNGPVH